MEFEIEALWIVALGEEIVSLQYLKGTTNVVLLYYRASTESSSIVEFMNSDFTGDLYKKRFLTSYVFTLSGCAISWGDATVNDCFVYYRDRVYGSNRGSESSYLVKGFGW